MCWSRLFRSNELTVTGLFLPEVYSNDSSRPCELPTSDLAVIAKQLASVRAIAP